MIVITTILSESRTFQHTTISSVISHVRVTIIFYHLTLDIAAELVRVRTHTPPYYVMVKID